MTIILIAIVLFFILKKRKKEDLNETPTGERLSARDQGGSTRLGSTAAQTGPLSTTNRLSTI